MARLKKPMRRPGNLPIFMQREGIFPLWPQPPALVRERANQKGKVKRRVSKEGARIRILPERAHLPQGQRPILEVPPTVSSVAKLDILLHNVPVDHPSQQEHLPSGSPSKRIKAADAMMVTDTALHAEEGVPHLSPRGWFGIQTSGASSMVIGHNTVMKVVNHIGERGVRTSRFLFHPVDKAFAFGGDAGREAQWSARNLVFSV